MSTLGPLELPRSREPAPGATSIAGATTGTWELALRLLRFTLPATLIMVLSGASLLVDTYFVTKLGSTAIAGVSLVFPFYLFLLTAFGGGIGVGASVVIAVRLGRRDEAGAQRAVGSALALALSVALAFTAGFAIGGRALFARMTADPALLDAAMRFAWPIFLGAPVIALALSLSNILRSEKRVREAAAMLLLSSAVNATLNPILIHGHLGAPALGVAGAGVATVLGFAASAALGARYLRSGRGHRLTLDHAFLRVAREDVRAITRIALPTLGTYLAASCVLLALSLVWSRFGVDALASYGLATRLEYLIAVVIYGVGAGILTLGGEAWGAGDYRGFTRICWTAAGGVTLATAGLAIALAATPAAWFELFGAPPPVVDAGARYLRIAALAYPCYALGLVLSYAYQTLGRAHLPLAWSLGRGFGIAVPIALAAADHGAIEAGAAGVAASLLLLGGAAAAWLPRSIARARAPEVLRAETPDAWCRLPALPIPPPDEPEAPPPERRIVKTSALRVSPYPLWYTLAWPWFFRHPSTRNHTAMPRLPQRFARPAPAGGHALRIVALGDIMVMQRDRVPVFDPALAALFASADVVVGTCEAAMGRAACDPAAQHHFLFNMPAAYLAGIVAQSGVLPERWYLSIANNHSGDIGPDGLAVTAAYLRGLGITPLGARIEGSPPLAIVERNGLRLGIAAWTHWLNLPEARAWRSPELLNVPWRELRAERGLDCLIGAGHWEYEWQHFPRRGSRDLARALAEAGFDLVIGSHPHVLQPLEWVGDTLCAYSLGNFCSGLGISFAARMCNVLTIDIGTVGDTRGKVIGYEVHLFAQLDDGERVSLVPLAAAPGALRVQIERRAALVLNRSA
jgi:putative MATE family efflux protein